MISTVRQTASRNPKPIVFVAAFTAFLTTFNETFLNVAFAPIMADFGVSESTVQWLAGALMLGAAVMVPVSAFAYRSVSTRRLFVITASLLVVGSLIGALAPSFPILLIGRIVQALGTGLLIPIGMNITFEVAPRGKLGSYMGIMGAMTTLGPSSSIIISGLLLTPFSWHALLWLYLGLSLALLICGVVFLGDIAKLTRPHLDVWSVILVCLALVGLLYGISTVFTGSLLVAVVAVLVGAAGLVLFVRRQGRLTQPLIDLRPMKVPTFRIGVVINMIALVSIFALNIIVPMYMQSVAGLPSLTAALVLFPAIALSCVLAPMAGRISDKHGPNHLLLVGFGLIAVFTIVFCLVIGSAPMIILALLYLPVIGGSALIIGPVQGFALSKLTPELSPHGVTVMSTGFQVAGCIGSSVITGIYAGATTGRTAAGESLTMAANAGVLIAGVVVAVLAVIGIGLALRLRRITQTGGTIGEDVILAELELTVDAESVH